MQIYLYQIFGLALITTNVYMQGLKWGNGCKWGSANPETTTTALNFFIYDGVTTMGGYNAGLY